MSDEKRLIEYSSVVRFIKDWAEERNAPQEDTSILLARLWSISEPPLGDLWKPCPNTGKPGHNHPANPCSICEGTGMVIVEWPPVTGEIEAINAACRQLDRLGFSTGHADSWEDLALECIDNLRDLQGKYRAVTGGAND